MKKVITPTTLASLNLGDPMMKLSRTKLSFNQAAVELLALKKGAKFVLEDEGNGLIFYRDTAASDAFVVENTYKYGGAYANHRYLIEYLFDRSVKEVSYLIGELKRRTTCADAKKKQVNKPKS